MATISKAIECKVDDVIHQGDVFKDISYAYIECQNNDDFNVIEFTFPYAIIISQSCDVIAMEEILNSKKGKATKYMPSILMCPFFEEETIKTCEHLKDVFDELGIELVQENLFNSKDADISAKDWHYRFHKLEIVCEKIKDCYFKDYYIDFKQYFTVPMSYLIQNKGNRLFRLDNLFAEQLTLKFATFLTRVAIP